MIYTIVNKIFRSTTYLIKSEDDDTCLVIDPGLDEFEIDNRISELRLKPLAILSTHGHFDHIGSVIGLKEKYGIPFYLHKEDLKISQSANFFLRIAQINHTIKTPTPDYFFTQKHEKLEIGSFKIEVHNFPGHSAGSCIIQVGNNLFSGDTIYKKGLGFNNFPGENRHLLKESVIEIFKTFSDESLILPGHGESEYLGIIKTNNFELLQFINKKDNA
jgi:hydroxyacylglutathione hydrolase